MDGLKKHLLNHLTKSMAHHTAMGNHHVDLAEHHAALSQECDPRSETSELHGKISNCHKSLARANADYATHLSEVYKAIEAGADEVWPVPVHEPAHRGHGGDLDGPEKLVRGAAPDNKNVTLVPRFGAPTKDDLAADMSKVPPEHAHIIRTS